MMNAPEMDTHESWRIFRILAEFVEGFEAMAGVGRAVSIFGSARTPPEDPYYRAAEETARLLARRKFGVITGGGPGIMEAANKGAFEARGKSVGLNITLLQEQAANKYQTLSLDFHYFYARKVMFVKYAQAFIYFPGGYGTLDEFFETITLVQTLKIEPRPIILYGSEYWSGLIAWMKKRLAPPGLIDGEDLDIFRLVDTPQQAASLAVSASKKPWWKPQQPHLDALHRAATKNSKNPLHGAKATRTGEGTRYGRRPRQSSERHVHPKDKPTQ